MPPGSGPRAGGCAPGRSLLVAGDRDAVGAGPPRTEGSAGCAPRSPARAVRAGRTGRRRGTRSDRHLPKVRCASACLRVCMPACLHVCMSSCLCAYLCTCLCTCLCASLCASLFACRCAGLYICINMCTISLNVYHAHFSAFLLKLQAKPPLLYTGRLFPRSGGPVVRPEGVGVRGREQAQDGRRLQRGLVAHRPEELDRAL